MRIAKTFTASWFLFLGAITINYLFIVVAEVLTLISWQLDALHISSSETKKIYDDRFQEHQPWTNNKMGLCKIIIRSNINISIKIRYYLYRYVCWSYSYLFCWTKFIFIISCYKTWLRKTLLIHQFFND